MCIRDSCYDLSLLADGPRMHDFLGEMFESVLKDKNLISIG